MEVHTEHLAKRNKTILVAYKVWKILQAKCEAYLVVPLVSGTKQPPLSEEHADIVDRMEALWESTTALSMTGGVSPEPFSAGLFL